MATLSNACAICLSPYSSEHAATSVYGPEHPDEHIFHPDCIQRWIGAQNRAQRPSFCPLCRRNITHIGGIEIPSSALIVNAVLSGNIDAVRAFLESRNDPPEIADEVFLYAVDRAIEEGDTSTVQILLRHVSEVTRGLSVALCAHRGDINCLRCILAHGPIPWWCRIGAITIAREGGHRDIALLLSREGCFTGLIKAATIGMTALAAVGAVYYQVSR